MEKGGPVHGLPVLVRRKNLYGLVNGLGLGGAALRAQPELLVDVLVIVRISIRGIANGRDR